MKNKRFAYLSVLLAFICSSAISAQTPMGANSGYGNIVVGAARPQKYLSQLKGKRVGLVVNQTSVVASGHVVDFLLSKKVDIKKIFAPEHGFRGKEDAGAKISNEIDPKTGIPIVSIYGKKHGPDSSDVADIDVLIFDIQDVGVRFYTYISTLQYVMEVCAAFKKTLIVLDRPNPNAHYIDGALLDPALKSFVGMQPIPVVYGMTIGEYALMLNGERWLKDELKCNLQVIACQKYTHQTMFELPVKPSPNLPNLRAILLYPSICYFEGTDFSLGRGTDKQFQIYGSPLATDGDFTFTPQPNEGASKPFQEGKLCRGHDLSGQEIKKIFAERQINLKYLTEAYHYFPQKDSFFLKGNFFDKLAGTYQLREQLKKGKSIAEIRNSWKVDLERFKAIRKKYLLYKD